MVPREDGVALKVAKVVVVKERGAKAEAVMAAVTAMVAMAMVDRGLSRVCWSRS